VNTEEQKARLIEEAKQSFARAIKKNEEDQEEM